jgi:hypothetical protein
MCGKHFRKGLYTGRDRTEPRDHPAHSACAGCRIQHRVPQRRLFIPVDQLARFVAFEFGQDFARPLRTYTSLRSLLSKARNFGAHNVTFLGTTPSLLRVIAGHHDSAESTNDKVAFMCGASWMRTPVGVFLNVQQCAAVRRLWHNVVSSATCRAVPADPKTMSVIDPVTHRPVAGQRGHAVRATSA